MNGVRPLFGEANGQHHKVTEDCKPSCAFTGLLDVWLLHSDDRSQTLRDAAVTRCPTHGKLARVFELDLTFELRPHLGLRR